MVVMVDMIFPCRFMKMVMLVVIGVLILEVKDAVDGVGACGGDDHPWCFIVSVMVVVEVLTTYNASYHMTVR